MFLKFYANPRRKKKSPILQQSNLLALPAIDKITIPMPTSGHPLLTLKELYLYVCNFISEVAFRSEKKTRFVLCKRRGVGFLNIIYVMKIIIKNYLEFLSS